MVLVLYTIWNHFRAPLDVFFLCLKKYRYLLVGILIDLLNTVGVLLGLDTTYLGMTILAIGNALPDSFTTISMVRRNITVEEGETKEERAQKNNNIQMAISGCYGYFFS